MACRAVLKIVAGKTVGSSILPPSANMEGWQSGLLHSVANRAAGRLAGSNPAPSAKYVKYIMTRYIPYKTGGHMTTFGVKNTGWYAIYCTQNVDVHKLWTMTNNEQYQK